MLLVVMTGILLLSSGNCKKKSNENPIPATVTDVDGNTYHTVRIGTQVWMVENLKVTHYRNGDPIFHVTDWLEWTAAPVGAYCNYNDDGTIAETYGRLYNWRAVYDSRNIAPEGWHVSTDDDWTILLGYLGGSSGAACKLKEIDTLHWASPNDCATNETGFTALPGSFRNEFGAFDKIGNLGTWWTSTQYQSYSWDYYMTFDKNDVFRSNNSRICGMSVRCVKD